MGHLRQGRIHITSYKGQVIPLTLGRLGEVGEDFSTTIQRPVKKVVAGDSRRTVSPLVNNDKKEERPIIVFQ